MKKAAKKTRSYGTGSLFKRGSTWHMAWTDANGKRHTKSARTTDKTIANRALAKEIERVAQIRNGLIDQKAEQRAVYVKLPLTKHLKAFEEALEAKVRTGERRREDLVRIVSKLIDGMEAKTWEDLTPNRVMTRLQNLREDKVLERGIDGKPKRIRQGISAQSFNHALQAIKQFTRWMVKDGRAAENPLEGLQGLNLKEHGRRERRAFTTNELQRLIDAADAGGDFRWGRGKVHGISGPGRALVYQLAVETGLRAGEIRSLTCQSFKLDRNPPMVTVEAGYSKRRREDTLPLREGLATRLKEHLKRKAPAAPAFTVPKHELAEMLRRDLDAAGVPREDDAGRVADFHSLRHTFITNLASSGVHPSVAQQLARHSTITLTMDRYTHVFAGDQLKALDALPELNASSRGESCAG